MNSTKTRRRGLTAAEICEILKSGKEAGIAELRYGDLQIFFNPTEIGRNKPENVTSGETLQQIELQALEREAIRAKEDELAELMLTDPARYERLIEDGVLEGEVSGT